MSFVLNDHFIFRAEAKWKKKHQKTVDGKKEKDIYY